MSERTRVLVLTALTLALFFASIGTAFWLADLAVGHLEEQGGP